MKREPSLSARGLFWCLLAARALASCAAAPEGRALGARSEELGPEVTLGIGAGSADQGDAVLGSAGVLAPVSDNFVFGGRFATYDYETQESGVLELDGRTFDASQTTSGSGLGLGAELRYYLGRALDGFWLGGGALYFPVSDAETTGRAREPATGLAFVEELPSDEVDFLPYGALGYTFRGAGKSSWTLELDAGSAAGTVFGALTLRIGYGF